MDGFIRRILAMILVVVLVVVSNGMVNYAEVKNSVSGQMITQEGSAHITPEKEKEDTEDILQKEMILSEKETSNQQKESSVKIEAEEGDTTEQVSQEQKTTEGEQPEEEKTITKSETEEVAAADQGSEMTEAGKDTPEAKTTEQGESQTTEQTTALKKDTTGQNSTTEQNSSSANSTESIQTTGADDEHTQEVSEKMPLSKSARSLTGPHDVDMPDLTSHYFKLQKDSVKVGQAQGSKIKVAKDVKDASRYIYTEMKDGNKYSFTPDMTEDSTVEVGGGSGGTVSLSAVSSSNRQQYGEIFTMVNTHKIEDRVFNLEQCKTNPYAIYTNVGTWYDSTDRKTYSVDLKMTVTSYVYPEKKIRDQLFNQYTAPYIAFRNDIIGIGVMACDTLDTKMEFYYHGTQKPITELRGVMQICDIDAQQGIDFGSGFEKIIMFDAEGSHLQYSNEGLLGESLGYVSSRSNINYSIGDDKTTALGVFRGSAVLLRWSIAKCDAKDTGGNAKYAEPNGYGIPKDSTDAESFSYYYSNSTGMIGVYTDLGFIPLPSELTKSLYQGSVNKQKSIEGKKELCLDSREDTFNYVLSSAVPSSSNYNKAFFTEFYFQDDIDPHLSIDQSAIKVFADNSIKNTEDSSVYNEVTSAFDIGISPQEDGSRRVKAAAKAEELKKEEFYGRTYYLHIPVQILSEEDMTAQGRSVKDLYQLDNKIGLHLNQGNYKGSFAVENQGDLSAISNIGIEKTISSNYTAAKIQMKIRVKKVGDQNGTPVAGVTFGLFGGAPTSYSKESKPLMTAVTDQKGIAVFQKDSGSFYQEEYGDGPYYIKELSVPDLFHSVWDPIVDTEWFFLIATLQDEALLMKSASLTEAVPKEALLMNIEKVNKKRSVQVYKKNTDTCSFIGGAEFVLYQWSQKKDTYVEVAKLLEGKDNKGVKYYYNAEEFVNTMDNLGRYCVRETKAPFGCVLKDETWEFVSEKDVTTFCHEFENDLQKGRIEIIKVGEDDKKLSDVSFNIIAKQDIYAPWVQGTEETPLVKKGVVVDQIVTGTDGVAMTTEGNELYPGEYLIEEIEGAAGYICNQEPQTIYLEYTADQKQKVITKSLTVTNDLMHPGFAISKIADRTRNQYGNAVRYDETTGRYIEEKVNGMYSSGDTVDYTILVTNIGNNDLYHIAVTDDPEEVNETYGYSLADYIDMDTAGFDLPKDQHIRSDKKDEIQVTEKEGSFAVELDHLKAGDRVRLHFTAKLNNKKGNAFSLKNNVSAEAQYYEREGSKKNSKLKDVPVEELVDENGINMTKDHDYIDIPGIPEVKVAKKADRTTGVTLKDGRYIGNRVQGTYEYAEKTDYKIVVTNSGSADLYNIVVEDEMTSELYQNIIKESVEFKEGIYKTVQGNTVCAVSKDDKDEKKHALILDALVAGDSIELHMTTKIASDVGEKSNLKNKVAVSAEYQTGENTFEKVPEMPEMKDEEKIAIGVPKLFIAKKADRTKGIVLKDGTYQGNRIFGSYQKGEKVIFTITASNFGKGNAHNILVKESPSEKMNQYLDVTGFSYKKGDKLTTVKGNMVTVIQAEKDQITLDLLASEDSVILNYYASVKKVDKTEQKLGNSVVVQGENNDGSSVATTDQMKDTDYVKVKPSRNNNQKVSSNHKNTTGSRDYGSRAYSSAKTGDSGLIEVYISVMLLCTAVIIFLRRRYQTKER